MIVLCIESSSDPTVIGLVDDSTLLKEVLLEDRDQLASAIAQLLAECGKKVEEIDAIAIGIGPGSFTGLRVGLAYAKGLARALTIPIWPVSSLQVLASNAIGQYNSIIAFTPARKGQAHAQRFSGKDLSDETEAAVVEYESMRDMANEGTAIVGPAIHKLEPDVYSSLEKYIPQDSTMHRAHAEKLARLARDHWQNITAPDAGTLVPVYGMDFGKKL
jgi:tRNA threonylcarbamoyl adenosine modification protein YeaZ